MNRTPHSPSARLPLQLAALRGVDVRILIPEKSDSVFVTLAAYSFFDEVGSTGVSFYRYQDGFLHGKMMLIDDTVATQKRGLDLGVARRTQQPSTATRLASKNPQLGGVAAQPPQPAAASPPSPPTRRLNLNLNPQTVTHTLHPVFDTRKVIVIPG